MQNTIKDIRIINVPKIEDYRGNISVIEKNLLPFKFKRVYYLYDIQSNAKRGGHAHIEQLIFLVAISGSFDVVLDDGVNEKVKMVLNKPNKGLLIPTGIWRELENFSSGAICLALASGEFDESEYIRDYNYFKSTKN